MDTRRWFICFCLLSLGACQEASEVYFPPVDGDGSAERDGMDLGDDLDAGADAAEDAPYDQASDGSGETGLDLGGDVDPDGDLSSDAGDAVDDVDWRDGDATIGDTGQAGEDPPDSGGDGYYPAQYPEGRTHSPITPFTLERLEEIAATGDGLMEDVFIKVGDSITVASSYLNCFAGSNVDLSGRTDLESTLDHFLDGDIDGSSPFDRASAAAMGGKTASWAISGTPSPLTQEVGIASPGFAVVMFGTNDIGWYPSDFGQEFRWYSNAMIVLVESLVDDGVIPILMSIPPRDDDAGLNRWVPSINLVVRGLAQAHQVPFVDFHRELMPLPSHGLASDGVHPNVYRPDNYTRPCVFTPEALAYGYNVRNLITLEALQRVQQAVVDSTFDVDDPTTPLTGDGSPQRPFEIELLPFAHWADTRQSTHTNLDTYTGCSATQNEAGPEYLYRLELTEPRSLRAFVVSRSTVDIDLHLLDSSASEGGCIERHHTVVERRLDAGVYVFSLDTFVSGGVAQSGEYLFGILECEPGDLACQ